MKPQCEMVFVVMYNDEIAQRISLEDAMALLAEHLEGGGTAAQATVALRKQLSDLMVQP